MHKIVDFKHKDKEEKSWLNFAVKLTMGKNYMKGVEGRPRLKLKRLRLLSGGFPFYHALSSTNPWGYTAAQVSKVKNNLKTG